MTRGDRLTWTQYIIHLRRSGHPPEVVDDLWRKVMAGGLERENFNPRLLLAWGHGDLLPPGTRLLLEAAQAKGLNASEIAKAIGVSPTLVSWWLRGKYRPRPKHFRALSELLGIPLEVLRQTFPSDEQEVVLSRKYLEDSSLPKPVRLYRRIGLMRYKAAYLAREPSPSYGDALWYAQYLVMEIFLHTLLPPRHIASWTLDELGLFPDGESQRFSGKGYTFLRQPLRFYLNHLRPKLEVGKNLFPGEVKGKRLFSHLGDVLYPFSGHALKRFVLQEAAEVVGSWGVRAIRSGGRSANRKRAPRLHEAWAAYIAVSVDEANSFLPISIEALSEGGKGGLASAEPAEEGVE
jgi:transcriptional regulator with XRE-family HTH domain